ncbi:prominin-1-like [Pomacea canaliculata]|uniref:prominin-1-like n=1 Tax=Pomacea canaliculata TaxID=400727 RepID=UPI000D7377A1|nr:prominin-1-like [Pomacea canaliculata]
MLHKTPCSILIPVLVLFVTSVLYVDGQTNNTLDTNGNIVWGQLAPDKQYKTTGYKADTGGLDPYYNLARSFINTSLPKKIPIDKFKSLFNGNGDMGTTAKELALDFVGFAICLVIGLLFIVIFPIVCLCFCCCRCCGNCGGKRLQKYDPKAGCKRICFGTSVMILSLFIIAGAACVFVSSDQMSKNLGNINQTIGDSFDDAETFVDNIDSQFNRLGTDNFLFLTNTVAVYVKDAAGEMAGNIILAVSTVVGLDAQLSNISGLSQQAQVQINDMSVKITTADSQRNTAVDSLRAANTNCPNCFNNQIATLNSLDFAAMSNQTDSLKAKVTTDVFKKMKDDANAQINSTVTAEISKVDVAGEMNNIYNDQLKPLLSETGSLRSTVRNTRDSLGDYSSMIKPYDKYRWYAGVGIASLLVLVAVLALVGVLCGWCGSSAKTRPTERGGASNCGGILLMSSVGLIFIFSALIMLLTTILYVVGSLSERYMCQTMQDFSQVDEYIKIFGSSFENGFSFNVMNHSMKMNVSGVMNGCRNDYTLYSVLGLEPIVNDSLKMISDFKENNLKFNFNTAQLTTDLKDINVTREISALENSVNDLSTLKVAIQNMTAIVNATRTSVAIHPSSPDTKPLDDLISTLVDMENIANNLQSITQDIKTEAQKLPNIISTAQTQLTNNTFMTDLITKVTTNFINAIFGFVDSYIGDILSKLKTDVAKCSPLYSIFSALVVETFCHGMVDPLNGFWLGLGWSIFFFMPSLILSVKLAKHFRRMLYSDGYDSPKRPTTEVFTTQTSQSITMGGSYSTPKRKNKVAPF